MARKLSQCPRLGGMRTTHLQPSRQTLQVHQGSYMTVMYFLAVHALLYAEH